MERHGNTTDPNMFCHKLLSSNNSQRLKHERIMEDTSGINNDDVRRFDIVAPNNAVAASPSTNTATERSTNPFLLAERTGTDAKYLSRIFLESRKQVEKGVF
jgi:hypothetical protein